MLQGVATGTASDGSGGAGGGGGRDRGGVPLGPTLLPGFGPPPGPPGAPPPSASAAHLSAHEQLYHQHLQAHHPHLPPHHPHAHHHHHPHAHPHETPKPRFLFRMPRVVPNQKEKFESDDLMKRHSREGEIRYTAFRDRPPLERQSKFIQSLREGHTEIAFIGTGFNLVLSFDTFTHAFHPPERRQIDFEKEPGKVYIRSPFVLNGVCVRWKGYLDLERLDGAGCLEFDEETAKLEDAVLREQVEAYNRRVKEFEEHRKQQQRQLAAIMGQHQAAMAAAAAAAAAATVSSSSSAPTPTAGATATASATSTSSEPNEDSVNSSPKNTRLSSSGCTADDSGVTERSDSSENKELSSTFLPIPQDEEEME